MNFIAGRSPQAAGTTAAPGHQDRQALITNSLICSTPPPPAPAQGSRAGGPAAPSCDPAPRGPLGGGRGGCPTPCAGWGAPPVTPTKRAHPPHPAAGPAASRRPSSPAPAAPTGAPAST